MEEIQSIFIGSQRFRLGRRSHHRRLVSGGRGVLSRGRGEQAVLQRIKRRLQRLVIGPDSTCRRDAGPVGIFVGVIE